VEPLSDEFNFSALRKKLRSKKMNIKTAMMDNKIVVGVGNIYINESLFNSGISPLREASSLKENEIKKLVSSIKKILKKAIDLGGSSISDYVTASGNLGNFQNNFCVYGRANKKCPHCQNLIKKIMQNGRSSFYCSICQK
jgi:formamidopyrimidine-DNA glycosylase